jgi:nucleoid-associated protein YgaU/DNA-binding SARP family transcriptional activator
MKRLIKGLAALVALAAAVGGIPWMLLRYGHWPITSLPTMAWVRHLNDRFVSDRTIVSVLTVAVWLVWAAFAYSVIIELAAALRGAKAPHISLAGPLQSMARGLVAAIVVTVSINHGSTSLAATMPAGLAVPRVPVAALVHGAPMTPMRSTVLTRSVDVRPTVRVETTPTRLAAVPLDVSVPRTVVVERNDSPWLIAERCLGDGMRWRELWDLNRGVTQADGRAWTDQQVLLQGWTLALPRTGVADAVDEQKSGSTIYVVVKGDTLSDIAEDELGNERLYPEIFDASRTIDQPDGRHLSDPNLILPGWKLSIPSHLQHPAPTAPVPSVPLPTAAVAVPAPPLPPSTTLPPPSGDAADPTLPPPSVVSSTAVTNPLPNTVVPVSIAPVTSAPPATTVARSGTRSGGSYIALLAAVGGSIALASGLAIRIGLLRRRRRTNSGTRRPKAEVHEPDIRTILRAADIPLVRWAGQELAQLVGDLKRADITAGPQAVELSGASGIEVLWSDPQQHAPERWQIADGGWAWRLPYDPEAPSPANSLPSAIPALVTIGIREGRQLLIDLEAFGSIAVNGPADMVDGFLRSVAVELATDQDLADAYVQVVGLDVPATRFERLTTTDIDEAVAELDGIRKSIADAMSVSHIDSTFVARVASDTPLEVTVAVIGTASPDGQIEPVPARSGVAVIGIGHAIEAACRIELSADGTARIEPLGITFKPVRLTVDASDAIENVFVELRNLAVEIDDVALVIAEAVPPEAVSGESDDQEPVTCQVAQLDLAPTAAGDVDLLDRASGNLPSAGSMDAVVSRPSGGDGEGIDENTSAPNVNGRSIGDEAPTLPFDPSDPPVDAERAGPKMVVKVLGVPCVPDRPNLGHREVVITTILACRGGAVAGSYVQDAVWEGSPVEQKTVWNIFGSTRTALGKFPDGTRVMLTSENRRLQLDPGVTTDLALLRSAVQNAQTTSSAEAIRLLSAALDMVDGQPFDDAGYDWAYSEQLVSEANSLIIAAACQLTPLALAAGVVDVARNAVRRALRAVPGDEDLYRCRLRVEGHSGNLTGVRSAYAELVAALKTLDAKPSDETVALYDRLVRHYVA